MGLYKSAEIYVWNTDQQDYFFLSGTPGGIRTLTKALTDMKPLVKQHGSQTLKIRIARPKDPPELALPIDGGKSVKQWLKTQPKTFDEVEKRYGVRFTWFKELTIKVAPRLLEGVHSEGDVLFISLDESHLDDLIEDIRGYRQTGPPVVGSYLLHAIFGKDILLAADWLGAE